MSEGHRSRSRPSVTHLEAAFGVAFDAALLRRALTHRSYAYENGGLPTNERLEFLGDSVLGVVITTALFHNHPDLPEGQLAKLRASVVNMRALADVARTLGPGGLGVHLRLGRGEEVTRGRDKASMLADTPEAILAAVDLPHGLHVARQADARRRSPELSNPGRGTRAEEPEQRNPSRSASADRPPDAVCVVVKTQPGEQRNGVPGRSAPSPPPAGGGAPTVGPGA